MDAGLVREPFPAAPDHRAPDLDRRGALALEGDGDGAAARQVLAHAEPAAARGEVHRRRAAPFGARAIADRQAAGRPGSEPAVRSGRNRFVAHAGCGAKVYFWTATRARQRARPGQPATGVGYA